MRKVQEQCTITNEAEFIKKLGILVSGSLVLTQLSVSVP